MSRYTCGDCENFRRQYLRRIGDALYSIDKNYDDMDFDNAVEKEVDMRGELDKIKQALRSAESELSSMVFE
jgi:hypothetical protein